jgi:general secretion pathway protein L
VATCFIFVKYLTTEGCLSLRLGDQGNIDAPLAERLFHDIKLLQTNASTIIIAPTEFFSLHQVQLPWLVDKKARIALSYSLEDKLANAIDELHFAFDRHYYHQGHYLVVVGQLTYLTDLITTLKTHHINTEIITIDWFALADNEVCLLDLSVLIYDSTCFLGALSIDLASFYLDKMLTKTIYTFTDSNKSLTLPNTCPQDEASSLWIARRLQTNKIINLNQGALHDKNTDITTKFWYYSLLTTSVVWLLIFIALHMLTSHTLTNKINQTDDAIATVYRQFFPHDKKIISPRFRITQLLKSSKDNHDKAFWFLLNQLTQVTSKTKATIKQLQFQNQVLQITVVCQNFNALEALELALQQAHIKIKQSQASSHKKYVTAHLELSI